MQSTHEIIIKLAPIFAPLSIPIVQHLFADYTERNSSKYSKLSLIEHFYREFLQARKDIYDYMDPFVLTGQYSTGWFSEILGRHSPGGKSISSTTRTSLERRNLLRKLDFGIPEYDAAATLIIARALFGEKSIKNWLPSFVEETEPWWWCWIKRNVEEPWESCPFPLPLTLPDTAILVTSWPGAAWKMPQERWLNLDDNLGATRFVGIYRSHGNNWNVTLSDLKIWNQYLAQCQIQPRNLEHIKPDMQRRIQVEADALLRDIAFQFLKTATFASYLTRVGGLNDERT